MAVVLGSVTAVASAARLGRGRGRAVASPGVMGRRKHKKDPNASRLHAVASGSTDRSVQQDCPRSARTFPFVDGFFDLTVDGINTGSSSATFTSSIFRTSLLSYAYERGYRQRFHLMGFPGEAAEFQLASEWMVAAKGDVLLDVSCASGLFARRFALSGDYKLVIASDYSEGMLKQCQQFDRQTPGLDQDAILRVRADVGRLPFATESIGAVHAGAAPHVWPDPLTAFAEIYRVLRPGGVFVSSTFILWGDFVGQAVLSAIPYMRQVIGFNVWTEPRLRQLTNAVGFQNFTCTRNRMFIMFCVRKPS
eukprot:jgi/Chlat1/1055/Chrsp110S01568